MNIITPKGERFKITGSDLPTPRRDSFFFINYSTVSAQCYIKCLVRDVTRAEFIMIKSLGRDLWYQVYIGGAGSGVTSTFKALPLEFPPAPSLGEIPHKFRCLIDGAFEVAISSVGPEHADLLAALIAYRESR